LAASASQAAEPPTDWQSGDDYWRQLQLPVGVEWSGNPLRPAVRNLARNQRICIWLDRRVDPGHRVSFRSEGAPLNTTLQKLAASFECSAGFVDSVVYLGPTDVASRLATVIAQRGEEVQQLPSDRQTRFLLRQGWHWDDLTAPQELLDELANEYQISFPNRDRIPHDLWPVTDLPPLPFAERLSLVLAGFSLTFAWDKDGTEVRFLPWPDTASLTRTYTHRGDVDRAVRELSQLFPNSQVTRAGARIAVTGAYEDQRLIERWLRGEKVAVAGQTRFSLKIENQPVGGVLQALARRLGYTLEVDPALDAPLRQLVTFRVENATAEELIERTLRDTRIRAVRSGNTLKLGPKP
jgi:hypothetical protein